MAEDWNKVPERGGSKALRFGVRLLNLLGLRFGLLIGNFVAAYFFITGRTSRRASKAYLKRLFRSLGKKPKHLGWHAFLHHRAFTTQIIDRLWFWQGKLRHFHFTWQGREHIEGRLGKGAILVGAHIGSFDAMRAFSYDRSLPVNVVMYRSHATNINSLFKQLNPESQVRIVELSEDNPNKVFELQERLEAGEFVAILADRPSPTGRDRTIDLPFLGDQTAFPQNPWILASILGYPVIFTVGVRLGFRRYHITAEPIADKLELPRKTRQEALEKVMTWYANRLETLCKEHHYQWFNFFDFWDDEKRKP
jgi:predicted LPLAT superfamily acyltransferase